MSLSRPVTCHSLSPQVRRLFQLLNQTEITVESLATDLGVSPTTVYDWATARSMPRIHNLEAAFNVLGHTLTTQPLEPQDG